MNQNLLATVKDALARIGLEPNMDKILVEESAVTVTLNRYEADNFMDALPQEGFDIYDHDGEGLSQIKVVVSLNIESQARKFVDDGHAISMSQGRRLAHQGYKPKMSKMKRHIESQPTIAEAIASLDGLIDGDADDALGRQLNGVRRVLVALRDRGILLVREKEGQNLRPFIAMPYPLFGPDPAEIIERYVDDYAISEDQNLVGTHVPMVTDFRP